MTDDEIKYRAFKVVWKVLGQVRPGITNEERFILAITATSNDKWEQAKRLNQRKIGQLSGNVMEMPCSDALSRQI